MHFININKMLPPPDLEMFCVEVDDKKRLEFLKKRNTSITRFYLTRMDKLLNLDILL
jgi:hypothetical protein